MLKVRIKIKAMQHTGSSPDRKHVINNFQPGCQGLTSQMHNFIVIS